jgi:hypothetical protein
MLISMPTGTWMILGVFQVIAFSQVVRRELHAGTEAKSTPDVAQVRKIASRTPILPPGQSHSTDRTKTTEPLHRPVRHDGNRCALASVRALQTSLAWARYSAMAYSGINETTKPDAERYREQIIQIADTRNEIRNEVGGRYGIAALFWHQPCYEC